MRIRLEDLKQSKYFKTSEILAGAEGLSRTVTSVLVLECLDTVKFLRGGELLLNSVYNFLGKEAEQKALIEGLYERGAAGLCVPENYLTEDHQLPPVMLKTANDLGFPVITFPEGYVFGEICEYVNNNLYSPVTKETMRENEVIQEMYSQAYQEGLPGIIRSLYKWTKMEVAILYEGELLSFPVERIRKDILLDPNQWSLKQGSRQHYNNIERYEYKGTQSTIEWLGAKIPVPSKFKNFVLLFKNGPEFTKEDEAILSASLSACAMEIKRIRNLSEIKRIYRKDLLDNILRNSLDYKEARHQVNLLGYSLPDEGRVVVLDLGADVAESAIKDCLYGFEDLLKEVLPSVPMWVQMNASRVVLLALDQDDSYVRNLYDKLHKRYPRLNFTIGIGNSKSYSEYNNSYLEACQAFEIGKCIKQAHPIFSYKDMGFYGFVNLVGNRENIQKYYDDYIKPLEGKFQGEYFDEIIYTLKQYLECRFHFARTAETMHVHRNTVTYRIGAIEKACNIDFQDYEDCLNMGIAMKLLPIIRQVGSEG
jgi:purine catabolism regulator